MNSVPRSHRSIRGIMTVVVVTGCLGLFVAGVLGKGLLTVGLAGAFLTVCAAITGWICGVRWGAAIIAIAAVLEFALDPALAGNGLLPFMLRWGIAVGLWIAAARVRALLESERRRARIDSLTGLPNRTAFFERCRMELSRARRSRLPWTLMLLDGDDFKSVNDRRGHAVGDRALQETAAALVESVRPYDLVSRLGGDEFAILFPETTAADAEGIAGRLQRALAARLAGFSPLTYCIGAVTFSGANSTDGVDECLKQADQALYAAKRHGKCSVQHAVFPAPEGQGGF